MEKVSVNYAKLLKTNQRSPVLFSARKCNALCCTGTMYNLYIVQAVCVYSSFVVNNRYGGIVTLRLLSPFQPFPIIIPVNGICISVFMIIVLIIKLMINQYSITIVNGISLIDILWEKLKPAIVAILSEGSCPPAIIGGGGWWDILSVGFRPR